MRDEGKYSRHFPLALVIQKDERRFWILGKGFRTIWACWKKIYGKRAGLLAKEVKQRVSSRRLLESLPGSTLFVPGVGSHHLALHLLLAFFRWAESGHTPHARQPPSLGSVTRFTVLSVSSSAFPFHDFYSKYAACGERTGNCTKPLRWSLLSGVGQWQKGKTSALGLDGFGPGPGSVLRQLHDLGGLLKLRGYVLTFPLLKLSLICLSPGLLLGPGNKYIPFQLCYIIVVVSY